MFKWKTWRKAKRQSEDDLIYVFLTAPILIELWKYFIFKKLVNVSKSWRPKDVESVPSSSDDDDDDNDVSKLLRDIQKCYHHLEDHKVKKDKRNPGKI